MRALAAGEDDLIIINSCAVTAEAVRQTRKAIRRARLARPEARIVVTGCAAQIEPESFARMPEVARVVGNADKLRAESFRLPSSVRAEPVEAPLFFTQEERKALRQAQGERREVASATPFSDRARALVKVQNGCDHSCTFCIIPQGRGASRSVPAGLVVDRIKQLVDQGFREVVLTGVDVTSYGPDLPGSPSLGMLVERILRHVPDLPRLRLSSLDSVEIDDRLFDLAAGEPRLMPHLHLSLQSGDDMILKRMKRRHSRAQAIDMVGRLKAARPEIAIGADLIAGFPTETEAMFENSLRLIDECDIVFGHIFPYSPRMGTPAARMPQVETVVAKARAKLLREASEKRQRAWFQGIVGTVQNVLIERDGQSGHAENFARVRLTPRHAELVSASPGQQAASAHAEEWTLKQVQGDESRAGTIVPTRITGLTATHVTGVPA